MSFRRPYEHPVNFGDNPNDFARQSSYDTDTIFTHQTARGIPAFDDTPRNQRGQTPAEELASDYGHSSSHTFVPSTTSVDRTMSPEAPGHDRISMVSTHMDSFGQSDITVNDLDNQKNPLVKNAAGFGLSDSKFENMEYAEPNGATRNVSTDEATPLTRSTDSRRYPLDQRIEDKKRGIGRQRHPFVSWILGVVLVAVFIYEAVVNWKAQGTPFSFHPAVNPMLGPSSSALINVGARFVPCMKQVQGVPVDFPLPCLNDTANPPDSICSLSDICGFGGFGDAGTAEPNQWFRFITPIFLHAGLVHLAMNLFAQLTISAQVEREMGSGGFFILYFAAGIFGNVLGANFSLLGSPSTGASGAIFGTVAVEWVDLAFHWKYTYRPVRKLMFLIVDLILGIAIGFIPFIDNFAHLGGLFMGLFAGVIFYPVISTTKKHKMITWACRIAAIPIPIVLFVVLTRNFYTGNPYSACSWCRYLSCIPTAANNHCHGTGLSFNGTQLNN